MVLGFAILLDPGGSTNYYAASIVDFFFFLKVMHSKIVGHSRTVHTYGECMYSTVHTVQNIP